MQIVVTDECALTLSNKKIKKKMRIDNERIKEEKSILSGHESILYLFALKR